MFIYKTTNTANSKIYVGKTKGKISNYLGSGKLLKLAIAKYGRSVFERTILERCDETSIDEREKYWISVLKSTNRGIGYNIATGGEGGDTISNHPDKAGIAERQSLKMLGQPQKRNRKPVSAETRLLLSKAAVGTNNPMFGKSHSAEAKDKIAQKQRARNQETRKVSAETRAKISSSLSGKSLSIQTRAKISEANAGDKNRFFGMTHSPESKHMMSTALSGIQKSKDHRENLSKSLKEFWSVPGNVPTNAVRVVVDGVQYESLANASRESNLPVSTIRNRIKSKNLNFMNTYLSDSPKGQM